MDRLWKAAMETLEGRLLMSFTFSAPVDFSTGDKFAIGAIAAADLNGDGIEDVVTLSQDGQVGVFVGNGNGTFKPVQSVSDQLNVAGGVTEQNLAVAKINGQEVIIASSSESTKVSYLTANSSGVWSVYGTDSTATHNEGVASLAVATIGASGSQAQYLIVGDTNTSGSDGSLEVSQFVSTTSFAATSTTSVIPHAIVYTNNSNVVETAALVSLATGDFIKSGVGTDLVVVGSNGVAAVFAGKNGGLDGTGGAAPISGITTADAVYSAGPSSVLVRNADGSITPLTGLQGTTNATAMKPIGAVLHPGLGSSETLAVGDFNGDGRADFVAANGSSFALFTGNGAGTYTQGAAITAADPHVVQVGAADVTGDGEADLIGGYYDSHSVYGVIGVSKNITSLAPTFTSSAAATAKVGSSFSFTVTANGFPAPKLTASGLPGGLSFHDNGNGTATISGVAGKVSKATFAVKLKATNATGTVDQTLVLTMDQGATFSGPTTAKVNEAAAITFAVTTKNGFPTTALTATFNGTAIDASGSHTVDGLEFTDEGNGDGVLNGTATSAADGTDTLVVTATSGGIISQQTYKLTIVQAPVFGATNTGTFTVGQFNTTGNIVVTGFPAPQISTGSGALPAGLSFKNNGDGTFVISGTPKPGTGGAHTVKLDAHNQTGHGTPQPFAFTVLVAQQPVITSANNTSFSVGKAGQSFTVKATGNTGDALPSFASGANAGNGIISGALPGGLTFTDGGNGTAKITGTPVAGSGGIYVVTIGTASDGAATPVTFASLGLTAVTQVFTITVNEAPGINATGSSTVTAGTAISPITIGTTTGFGTTTLKLNGSLPKGLTFTDHGVGTSTITGTPLAGTGGTYKFSVTATNAAGSATEQYTLTVDQTPTFSDGTTAKTVSVTHGSNVNQTISLSGFGIPFTFSAGPTNVPAGMTLTLNSAGNALILHGAAPAGVNTSTSITFTLKNADGTLTSPMGIVLLTT